MASPTTAINALKAKLRWFTPTYAAELNKRVKDKTPVDTGRLRAGWEVQATTGALDLTNAVPYAGFVELGTSKMAPRAMLRRTLLEAQPISDLVAKRLDL